MGATSEDERFSFHRFARQSFYEAVNARLVDLANVDTRRCVLDLACGTGAVTQLILDKLQGLRDRCVVGMDASTEALDIARRNLAERRNATVEFIQGQAESLSDSVQRRVDAVIFCNAIHMMEEKDAIVGEVNRILTPGGVFAFNTTFFEGAQPSETEMFYRRWMMRALRYLKRQYGLKPDRERVVARQPLDVAEYEALLKRQGFDVAERRLETVNVPLEGWLGISQFRDFVQGALPGVPLDEAVEALQNTVSQVFEEMDIESVPRLWLHVVAVRPSGTA